MTVHDVLLKYGCDVDAAREGNEAMAFVRQREYDLVISDIRMPGSNGYDIFKAVKEIRPGCPVMFMTGFGYDPSHSIIRATPEGLAAGALQALQGRRTAHRGPQGALADPQGVSRRLIQWGGRRHPMMDMTARRPSRVRQSADGQVQRDINRNGRAVPDARSLAAR